MGWRTIYIEEAIKINYKLNSLGILKNDDILWINLDEIDIVILECLKCNVSSKLLSELSKKGISVIICGEDHMPIGILNSIENNQRSAKFNRLQLEWNKGIKKEIWKLIVKQKILLQTIVLLKNEKKKKIDLMLEYYENVELGDITNREGLAAKVYFHELFGMDFIRRRNSDDIFNSCLNFMYQIIRAKISQEIIAHGYNPSLSIFHCNEYNYFGLADDIIEVYRPIVDFYVTELIKNEEIIFLTPRVKEKLLNILYEEVLFDGKKQKIIETIKLTVISITNSLTDKKIEILKFPSFYEN